MNNQRPPLRQERNGSWSEYQSRGRNHGRFNDSVPRRVWSNDCWNRRWLNQRKVPDEAPTYKDFLDEELRAEKQRTTSLVKSKLQTLTAEDKSNSIKQLLKETSEEITLACEKETNEKEPRRIAHVPKPTRSVPPPRPPPQFLGMHMEHNHNTAENGSNTIQQNIQRKLLQDLMGRSVADLKKVICCPRDGDNLFFSHLLKKTRVLLSDAMRKLAEHKLKIAQGDSSQMPTELENLMDPDIATDVCSMPLETIQALRDIFDMNLDGDLDFETLPCKPMDPVVKEKTTDQMYPMDMPHPSSLTYTAIPKANDSIVCFFNRESSGIECVENSITPSNNLDVQFTGSRMVATTYTAIPSLLNSNKKASQDWLDSNFEVDNTNVMHKGMQRIGEHWKDNKTRLTHLKHQRSAPVNDDKVSTSCELIASPARPSHCLAFKGNKSRSKKLILPVETTPAQVKSALESKNTNECKKKNKFKAEISKIKSVPTQESPPFTNKSLDKVKCLLSARVDIAETVHSQDTCNTYAEMESAIDNAMVSENYKDIGSQTDVIATGNEEIQDILCGTRSGQVHNSNLYANKFTQTSGKGLRALNKMVDNNSDACRFLSHSSFEEDNSGKGVSSSTFNEAKYVSNAAVQIDKINHLHTCEKKCVQEEALVAELNSFREDVRALGTSAASPLRRCLVTHMLEVMTCSFQNFYSLFSGIHSANGKNVTSACCQNKRQLDDKESFGKQIQNRTSKKELFKEKRKLDSSLLCDQKGPMKMDKSILHGRQVAQIQPIADNEFAGAKESRIDINVTNQSLDQALDREPCYPFEYNNKKQKLVVNVKKAEDKKGIKPAKVMQIDHKTKFKKPVLRDMVTHSDVPDSNASHWKQHNELKVFSNNNDDLISQIDGIKKLHQHEGDELSGATEAIETDEWYKKAFKLRDCYVLCQMSNRVQHPLAVPTSQQAAVTRIKPFDLTFGTSNLNE